MDQATFERRVFQAIEKDDFPTAKYFLDQVQVLKKVTAELFIVEAVRLNRTKFVKLLLRKGASTNIKIDFVSEMRGYSLLEYAINCASPDYAISSAFSEYVTLSRIEYDIKMASLRDRST